MAFAVPLLCPLSAQILAGDNVTITPAPGVAGPLTISTTTPVVPTPTMLVLDTELLALSGACLNVGNPTAIYDGGDALFINFGGIKNLSLPFFEYQTGITPGGQSNSTITITTPPLFDMTPFLPTRDQTIQPVCVINSATNDLFYSGYANVSAVPGTTQLQIVVAPELIPTTGVGAGTSQFFDVTNALIGWTEITLTYR